MFKVIDTETNGCIAEFEVEKKAKTSAGMPNVRCATGQKVVIESIDLNDSGPEAVKGYVIINAIEETKHMQMSWSLAGKWSGESGSADLHIVEPGTEAEWDKKEAASNARLDEGVRAKKRIVESLAKVLMGQADDAEDDSAHVSKLRDQIMLAALPVCMKQAIKENVLEKVGEFAYTVADVVLRARAKQSENPIADAMKSLAKLLREARQANEK